MTESEIKSGQKILEEFFSGLASDDSLDQDTVAAMVDLFNKGALTSTNLANALSEIRESGKHD